MSVTLSPVAAVEVLVHKLIDALRSRQPYAEIASLRDECWDVLTAGAVGFRVGPGFSCADSSTLARLESLYEILVPGAGGLHLRPNKAAAELAATLSPNRRSHRPRCRLKIKGQQLILDGQPVRLDLTPEARDQTLTFLKYLLKEPGQYVSGGDIDRAEGQRTAGLAGVRWDRVKSRLPSTIKELIETDKRKGSRLSPSILA